MGFAHCCNLPAAGSISRLRMPVGFFSMAAVVMTPLIISLNPGRFQGGWEGGEVLWSGWDLPRTGTGWHVHSDPPGLDPAMAYGWEIWSEADRVPRETRAGIQA